MERHAKAPITRAPWDERNIVDIFKKNVCLLVKRQFCGKMEYKAIQNKSFCKYFLHGSYLQTRPVFCISNTNTYLKYKIRIWKSILNTLHDKSIWKVAKYIFLAKYLQILFLTHQILFFACGNVFWSVFVSF